jgi:VirE N-terminal domain
MQIEKKTAHPFTNAQLSQRNSDKDTPSHTSVNSIKVSRFNGAKNAKPCGEVTIGYVLETIRTGGKGGTIRHQVEAIRDKHRYGDENAKKLAQELKQQLPAVTFSETFTERKNNALVQHSGFLCADLDHVSDVAAIKDKLAQSPHVVGNFYFAKWRWIKCCLSRISRCSATHRQLSRGRATHPRANWRPDRSMRAETRLGCVS